jgi:hypothetical protein
LARDKTITITIINLSDFDCKGIILFAFIVQACSCYLNFPCGADFKEIVAIASGDLKTCNYASGGNSTKRSPLAIATISLKSAPQGKFK